MPPYATRDHVYNLGLTARAFARAPRPVEAVDPATGTIRLTAHGLSVDDLVLLDAVSGGTLIGGVSAFTYYSPVIVGADLFQLEGVATFSSSGQGVRVSTDPGRRIDQHLADAAALIDEHLTAHAVPLQPDPTTGAYPQVVIGMNARMAARAAVTSLQIENAAFREAVDRLMAQEEFDRLILADWKRGKPVQPRPTDLTPSTADNGAVWVSAAPTDEWSGTI